MTENLFNVPEPPQLVALTEVLEIIWLGQNIKHKPKAESIERMLLKRGFRIVPVAPLPPDPNTGS